MKIIKSLVALLSSLILAGGLVFAFVLFDPPAKWLAGDLPRNIQINQSGHSSVTDPDGGVTEIVDAVANSWNAAVPDPVPGPSNGLTSTTVVADPPVSVGDGISTMHFNVVGTGCSGSCLAVTFTPVTTSGSEVVNGVTFGGITDSDIFFNPSAKFYSSSEPDGCDREYHIESVAVHEVGHLLGLGHTPVSNATMFATTDPCSNNGESLAQDDIDGIRCIYEDGAGCAACVSSTLVVSATDCSQPSSGPNSGDFVVETFIADNCGTAVAGADVTIDIPVSPLGPLTCSGQTSSSGRLGCALANPPDGLYESLVGDVAESSFPLWDASECAGIGEPPCGCSIQIGEGACGDGVCDAGEETSCPEDCTDTDFDGVADFLDNCPEVPNSDQLNADGDEAGDVCDCDPQNDQAWSTPGEVAGLTLDHDSSSGITTLTWSAPADPGATSVVYDTLGSDAPPDFFGGGVCVETDDGADLSASDADPIGPGDLRAYLIRAENQCPSPADEGSLGEASDGTPRDGLACP